MSEKKLDLIAQMLAKAESTTPEEAEALTEHAERLMLKYQIDQAMIDSRRQAGSKSKEQIVTKTVDLVGSYRKALMNMWYSIGLSYGPLQFLKSNDNGKFIRLSIIGYSGDVDQYITLGTSLQVQATVALRAWWLAHKAEYAGVRSYEQWEARSSFINGFGNGAAKRIRDNKYKIIEEAGTGTEIVLADRGTAVREYFDNIPSRKARATKQAYDPAANGAGNKAGQNARTGEKAITNIKPVTA